MGETDSIGTFGERFLSKLRQLSGATVFDYATAQRIKQMSRDEVLGVLRQSAGLEYARLQELKTCDDPEAMANVLFDEARRMQQAVALWLLF